MRTTRAGWLATTVFGVWSLCMWNAIACAQPAPAAGTGARLEYARDAGAARCPDQAELGAAVARQVGYPVFEQSPAARVIRIAIERRVQALHARVEIRSIEGELLGSRELDSPETDCRELGSTLALTVAMALDPLRLAAERPGQSASEASAAAPRACPIIPPCPVCPRVPERASERWEFAHVAVGPALELGAVPAPSAALALEVGANFTHVGIALAALADAGAQTRASDGSRIEAQRTLGIIALCGRLSPSERFAWAVCGAGALGALRGHGIDTARRGNSLVGSVGLRSSAELRLTGSLWARIQGDVQINLTRAELEVGGASGWNTPPLWAALGLALAVHFL